MSDWLCKFQVIARILDAVFHEAALCWHCKFITRTGEFYDETITVLPFVITSQWSLFVCINVVAHNRPAIIVRKCYFC
jgi:hypothetical protein